MSHLVLELKPGETMLINGAGIRFRTKTRLELTARARFLFGKQVMAEEQASTPARRIYHALQVAYVGTDAERDQAVGMVHRMLDVARPVLGHSLFPLVDAVRDAVEIEDWYSALKQVKRLIQLEDLDDSRRGEGQGEDLRSALPSSSGAMSDGD